MRGLSGTWGPRVFEIVEACSDTFDPPKPPWKKRKETYLRDLAGTSDAAVLRVLLADKLHNARAIVGDLREIGEELWMSMAMKKSPLVAG